MTNEEVMKLMTEMGLHEGGMDNWVSYNAWVKFAKLVAAHEREACAKVCETEADNPSCLWEEPGCWQHAAENCAGSIRSEEHTSELQSH